MAAVPAAVGGQVNVKPLLDMLKGLQLETLALNVPADKDYLRERSLLLLQAMEDLLRAFCRSAEDCDPIFFHCLIPDDDQ